MENAILNLMLQAEKCESAEEAALILDAVKAIEIMEKSFGKSLSMDQMEAML